MGFAGARPIEDAPGPTPAATTSTQMEQLWEPSGGIHELADVERIRRFVAALDTAVSSRRGVIAVNPAHSYRALRMYGADSPAAREFGERELNGLGRSLVDLISRTHLRD
jgi:hypothetical protein